MADDMMRREQFPGLVPYLLVVFLNAFVDLGHKIIIQNTIFKIYDGPQQILLTAIVNALILLPFIACFTPAGFCSDKYPKHLVMRASACAAVLLTLLITLFYYLGWFWSAFAMTFALALQSAFYSPAKYGYIKELVGKENLSWANGWVQATTITAILLGLLFFSMLFEFLLVGTKPSNKSALLAQVAVIGWGLVLLSGIEAILCLLVPRTQDTRRELRYPWRRYLRGECLRDGLRGILGNRMILVSIASLAVFWSISQVMLATFPAHAKETMGIINTVIIQGAMAWAGIGIIIGSMLASRVSGRHIETSLIPIGALGVALCLALLPGLPSIALQSINFLLWGIFGGLMIVPLNALIQFHAGRDELGKVLAANNLLQNVAMFSFLVLTVAVTLAGLSGRGIFALLLVVALAGAVGATRALPQSLLRPWLTRATGRRHRLRALGLDHLPERGGVLLVGERGAWPDWAMVQIASPRPVCLVAPDVASPPWRWLTRLFRTTPADRASVRAALEENQLLCLFPGDGRKAPGLTLEELEPLIEGTGAVVQPLCILGQYTGEPGHSDVSPGRSSRQPPCQVVVAFGAPMPPHREALEKGLADLALAARELGQQGACSSGR